MRMTFELEVIIAPDAWAHWNDIPRSEVVEDLRTYLTSHNPIHGFSGAIDDADGEIIIRSAATEPMLSGRTCTEASSENDPSPTETLSGGAEWHRTADEHHRCDECQGYMPTDSDSLDEITTGRLRELTVELLGEGDRLVYDDGMVSCPIVAITTELDSDEFCLQFTDDDHASYDRSAVVTILREDHQCPGQH